MTYYVTVTSQGQISIPAPIRHKYGLTANTKIVIEDNQENLTLKPAVNLLDLKGIFKTDKKIPFSKIRQGFEDALANGTA